MRIFKMVYMKPGLSEEFDVQVPDNAIRLVNVSFEMDPEYNCTYITAYWECKPSRFADSSSLL